MQQCQAIRSEPINPDRLRDLDPIIDPKLNEEERIDEIILRVYNMNANVYIKIRLDDFILKIVDELEHIQ